MANNLLVKLLLETKQFDTNINNSRKQIQAFQKNIKEGGNILNSFGNSMGINISSITKFGTAIGIAAVAGETLKKSLQTNADFMDEFNRFTEIAKGTLDSFYSSLGNGRGITDFFKNWDNVKNASIAYANAIDNANTAHNTMNNAMGQYQKIVDYCNIKLRDPALSGEDRKYWIDRQNDALREQLRIQALIAEADINKRNGQFNRDFVAAGGSANLSETQKQWYENVRADGKTNWEDLAETYLHREKRLKKIIEDGTSRTFYRDGTVVTNLTDEAKQAEKELQALTNSKAYKDVMAYKEMENQGKTVDTSWANRLSQTDIDIAEASAELARNRAKNRIKTPTSQTPKVASNQTIKADAKTLGIRDTFENDVTPIIQPKIKLPDDFEQQAEEVKNALMLKLADVTEEFNFTNQIEGLGLLADAFDNLGYAIAGIDRQSDSLRQFANVVIMTAKAASIAKMIEAAVMDWSNFTVFQKIATATMGVATIVSMFSNLQQFANGGIVGGKSFTGDNMLIRANSGEMVVSTAQQRNLFNILNNGNVGVNNQVRFVLHGQELVGLFENYNNKRNRTL